MPVITLINKKQYRYEHPVSPIQIAENIKPILLNKYVAARINGKLADLIDIILCDSVVEFITTDELIGLNVIKQSCVHLLGYAIKQLWPTAKMVEGAISELGFHYDIDLNFDLTEQELEILKQKMLSLVNKKYNIIKRLVSKSQATQIFLSLGEPHKILALHKKTADIDYIELYLHEEHVDMCCGPQVPNISFCQYFKLYKISKINWNDANSQKIKLQRIYGALIDDNQGIQLLSNNYLNKSKKLKKYDHRNLAKQLDLYHIHENAPGMIFWHENGLIIFQELKNFIRKKLKQYHYKEVKSPTMIDRSLWEKTGHWENYHEHIFTTTSENREYCIKPMNCPGHIQIFNQNIKSYKDLPVRIAEFGNCHRNEFSGSLHGLMRIREFTQDDAHIFCSIDQIQNELNHCINMMYDVYNTFGFKNIQINLSTRPKRRIGDESQWDTAEQLLCSVLQENNITFQNQPYDGAFYGPKIELNLLDSLGRTWQCGTIQIDFSLPNLLDSYYVDRDNTRQTPVIIHRAILGSIERFIGLLTEEYLGFLPTWLAPIQVVLITVTDEQSEYVAALEKKLIYENIRVKTDLRNETIGFKIRLYTLHRIPYMLICGKSEMNQGTISIRTYKGKKIENYNVNMFLKKLKYEIQHHNLNQMEE